MRVRVRAMHLQFVVASAGYAAVLLRVRVGVRVRVRAKFRVS